MLQCFNCKHWIHCECTRLPKYTLASLEKSQRGYSSEKCIYIYIYIYIYIPEEFWEEDSLNPADKRTNDNEKPSTSNEESMKK